MSEADDVSFEVCPEPDRECDLVLEGGIAGGVVYPRAILAIARTHRLRNLGGASAGAIALALAAAAEYHRATTRSCDGFRRLGVVDAELRTPGFLAELFQARPSGQPVLDFVSELYEAKANLAREQARADRLASGEGAMTRWAKKWRRLQPWLHALRTQESGGALGGLAGGALGALLVAPWAHAAASTGTPLGILGAAVLGFGAFRLGAAAGEVVGGVDELLTRVDLHLQPSRAFGLCTGVANGQRRSPALFDWLHAHVQGIAGRGVDHPPLTFAELEALDARHAIQARMVTTNLNAQRPHRVPFEDGEIFVFRKADLEALLPAPLFRAVCDLAARPPAGAGHLRLPPDGEFGWFPSGLDMPVVVGVRLSMSFPLLFSAVRLFMVTQAATADLTPRVLEPTTELSECWFSDGGLCNNFPLQFFDVWYPERLTFGINLSDPPLAASARMAAGGASLAGRLVDRREPDDDRRDDWVPHALEGTGDFLSTLAETLLSHRDNATIRLASFRERVSTVHLGVGEGSLNLKMPTARIAALGRRGEEAAAALEALVVPHHQWLRLRTLLGALEAEITRMRPFFRRSPQMEPRPVFGFAGLWSAWVELIEAARDAEKSGTPWYPASGAAPGDVDAWYDAFTDRARELVDLMSAWAPGDDTGAPAPPFLDAGRDAGAPPRPRGDLRISPRA